MLPVWDRPPVEPARQRDLRERNLASVLGTVAGAGEPPSRAQLAGVTGLTRATVSALVESLLTADLVEEVPPPPRTGAGRPASGLRLSGHRVAALGAEVGVDYLAGCVRDLTGTVRAREVVPGDNRGLPPVDVLGRSADLGARLLGRAGDLGLEVVGAAWALPGLVDAAQGRVCLAPNLAWRDVDVRGLLTASEHGAALAALPLAVANEADLAALAELETSDEDGGRGRGFLLVSGEVGIGAGVVLDGRLVTGGRGWSGELGHVTVDPSGPACSCGSLGCLEVYAGQEAVLRAAGRPGEPATALGEAGPRSTLAEAATRGDAAVLQALERAGTALGVAAAAAVNVLDVDTLVLGGIYAPLAPWLCGPVERELARRVLRARLVPVPVRVARTGPDAAVLGAASTVLQRVLAEPALYLRAPERA